MYSIVLFLCLKLYKDSRGGAGKKRKFLTLIWVLGSYVNFIPSFLLNCSCYRSLSVCRYCRGNEALKVTRHKITEM